MLRKQTFHISHLRISQNVKGVLMWNLRITVFMWRQRYWEIFISEPLISWDKTKILHALDFTCFSSANRFNSLVFT